MTSGDASTVANPATVMGTQEQLLLATLVGLRHRAGLTQAQLAKRMGVGRGYVSALERSTEGLSTDDATRYAAAAGARLSFELQVVPVLIPEQGGGMTGHGYIRYAKGCRCDVCTAGHTEWITDYRIRRKANRGLPMLLPATGSQRRVQALAAIGWSQRELARRLGRRATFVSQLRYRTAVTASSAAAVVALYNELSMLPGPSDKARRHALAAGWPPPLAWDDDSIDDPNAEPDVDCSGFLSSTSDVDEVVVDRILSGRNCQANKAERFAVLARWQAAGRALNDLERLTGWNVHRLVAESRRRQQAASSDEIEEAA